MVSLPGVVALCDRTPGRAWCVTDRTTPPSGSAANIRWRRVPVDVLTSSHQSRRTPAHRMLPDPHEVGVRRSPASTSQRGQQTARLQIRPRTRPRTFAKRAGQAVRAGSKGLPLSLDHPKIAQQTPEPQGLAPAQSQSPCMTVQRTGIAAERRTGPGPRRRRQ